MSPPLHKALTFSNLFFQLSLVDSSMTVDFLCALIERDNREPHFTFGDQRPHLKRPETLFKRRSDSTYRRTAKPAALQCLHCAAGCTNTNNFVKSALIPLRNFYKRPHAPYATCSNSKLIFKSMERGGPFSQEEGDDDRHRIPRGYEVKLNVYDMVRHGFGRQQLLCDIHTRHICTHTHVR